VNAFSYIQNHVFVKLKPSKLQGIGVFAIRNIPKGTYIFERWTGNTGSFPIQERQPRSLPKELYTHIKDIFLYAPDFPLNTDTFVDLTNGCHWIYTTPYYFVNSGLDRANIDKDSLTSLRDIKAGEEILSNYGRYERFKPDRII